MVMVMETMLVQRKRRIKRKRRKPKRVRRVKEVPMNLRRRKRLRSGKLRLKKTLTSTTNHSTTTGLIETRLRTTSKSTIVIWLSERLNHS